MHIIYKVPGGKMKDLPDLPEMLEKLSSAGLSLSLIATMCETTQPTISRVKSGREPKYKVGKRIENLYKKYFITSQLTNINGHEKDVA